MVLLTLMPSHRETARNGLKALSVRIERNAGMSAAPAIIAPKFISESFHIFYNFFFFLCFLKIYFNLKTFVYLVKI
jgi:hypothetical protein